MYVCILYLCFILLTVRYWNSLKNVIFNFNIICIIYIFIIINIIYIIIKRLILYYKWLIVIL